MNGRSLFRGIAVLAVILGICASGAGFHAMQASAASTSTPQDQISADDQQIAQLNQQIAIYETELQKIGSDKKTLQQAINALDLQRKAVEAHIAITQHTINSTQSRISQLGSNIASTQQQIAAEQESLAADLREVQASDDQPFVVQLLTSQSLSDVWQDVEVLSQLDNAIQISVQSLHSKQTNLTDAQQASQEQKTALIQQRDTLLSQQDSLAQTKQSKAQLLAETNSKESTYEQLLAQAKAQLASFSTFSQNAGGSGLLSNQTSCDSWGCYYNQRDSAWGNDPLNGTQYLLKSDGCLITSVAMVLTHYGYQDVTPVTINSNPSNFAAYYPAYLLFTIHVDGNTVTRIASAIDQTLATGNPVIVGLHAYGGTHFVVLVSGSNGNYLMRDPYIPNGNDVSFLAHYSMREIYAIEKVTIS